MLPPQTRGQGYAANWLARVALLPQVALPMPETTRRWPGPISAHDFTNWQFSVVGSCRPVQSFTGLVRIRMLPWPNRWLQTGTRVARIQDSVPSQQC